MKSILALAGLALPLAVHSGTAIADKSGRPPDITLTTETPVVDVPAHRPGRQFLELPALEYAFDVEARCDDDWVPESLSLSVADSRVDLGTAQLAGAEPPRIVLQVPARQLAPVAVHGFCLLEDDQRATNRAESAALSSPLTIRAVLSAQASLLCRNEAERRITYVSQPLDVQLACQPRPTVATGL